MRKCNRLILLISVIYFSAFYGCNNQTTKAVKTGEEAMEVHLNFDSILHCYDYSYLNDYFFTADYGCLYDPNGKNTFGNLTVYLIPHKRVEIPKGEYMAERMSSLDVATIKKEFNVYVFLIPVEQLNYNPAGDPPYYQKENFTEKLYGFDKTNNQWNLIDSILISGAAGNEKEQNWREGFILSKIKW